MIGKQIVEDARIAREISDRLLALGLYAGIALAVVMAAVSGFLPGIFTDEVAVVAAIGSAYAFVVFLQPLGAVVFVWDGIAIGAASFNYLAWTMLGSAAVASAFLLLVIPLGWGLAGVWWAMVVLMVARAVSLWWWYVRGPLGAEPGRALSSPAT